MTLQNPATKKTVTINKTPFFQTIEWKMRFTFSLSCRVSAKKRPIQTEQHTSYRFVAFGFCTLIKKSLFDGDGLILFLMCVHRYVLQLVSRWNYGIIIERGFKIDFQFRFKHESVSSISHRTYWRWKCIAYIDTIFFETLLHYSNSSATDMLRVLQTA